MPSGDSDCSSQGLLSPTQEDRSFHTRCSRRHKDTSFQRGLSQRQEDTPGQGLLSQRHVDIVGQGLFSPAQEDALDLTKGALIPLGSWESFQMQKVSRCRNHLLGRRIPMGGSAPAAEMWVTLISGVKFCVCVSAFICNFSWQRSYCAHDHLNWQVWDPVPVNTWYTSRPTSTML
jgi:hypothetical protein